MGSSFLHHILWAKLLTLKFRKDLIERQWLTIQSMRYICHFDHNSHLEFHFFLYFGGTLLILARGDEFLKRPFKALFDFKVRYYEDVLFVLRHEANLVGWPCFQLVERACDVTQIKPGPRCIILLMENIIAKQFEEESVASFAPGIVSIVAWAVNYRVQFHNKSENKLEFSIPQILFSVAFGFHLMTSCIWNRATENQV